LYPCVVLHPPPVVPAAMAVASAGLLYYIIPPLVVRDARDARNARACFSRRPEFVRQLHKRLINFQLHPKEGGRGPIHHWSFLTVCDSSFVCPLFRWRLLYERVRRHNTTRRRTDGGPTVCVCVCVRACVYVFYVSACVE
jgi:hypothetical protein